MATQTNRPKRRPTPTQIRATRRVRRHRRKRFLKLGGVTLISAISLAFIVSLFIGSPGFTGGGAGGIIPSRAPSGPGERIEDAGAVHISTGQPHADYTSNPATSGPHFGQPMAPTRWGIHDEALPPEVYIHNLEHGGVAIFYDCPDGCPELVSQLTEIISRGQVGGLKVLMAPHEGMDTQIALAAWTFLDKLDAFDGERIEDFLSTHESSANAPEPFAR